MEINDRTEEEIPTTVELKLLEHLWNHENMFETGVVRAKECYSLCQVFSIFFNIRYVVCSHENRLIEAILMSAHNIPFSI